MRCVLSLALAAGCSFTPTGGTVADDDGGTGDDAGDVPMALRDDSAADFAVAGAALDSAVVEPWGAIAPAAFHVGGLVAHAANSERFGEPDEATWAMVTGASAAGTGVFARSITGDPEGVGLDSGDSWTYWAEGEVWLDAGETTFLVDIDDAGFIEIAPLGGAFTRVVNARLGVSTGAYTAATTGWHALRLAMREGIGASKLDVQMYINGSATPVPLAGARLRTRVDNLRGMMLEGWDSTLMQGRPGITVADAALVDARFQNNAPVGVGITAADSWSLRWSGQFYVTTAGTYSLRVESDDGHRLYVGSQVVTDALAGGTTDRTAAVGLVAGWNDLVLDLNENSGDAMVRLRVVAGPEPGLQDELPATRLRPLAPRTERLETVGDATDLLVPDGDANGASRSVKVAGFPGATVASVDVIVGLNHPRIADLQVRLIHPGGNEVLLRNNTSEGGSGPRSLRFVIETFDDTPAEGEWTVRVTDTANGQVGSLTDVQLAVHMANGPDQIARTASYTSPVRDLGEGVRTLGAVTLGARLPVGAGATVRLRGCDTAEACEAEPWSAPLADGDPAGLPARRYLQYRLELTSGGEREAEIDFVELAYSRAP
ncbi:MAG TPA: proprotein convertase P-domain-containing protein [Kofleriaceae bacterium]|nr:proprotein convertase P-domain-containing protein [Kofleriaceae bacterium]